MPADTDSDTAEHVDAEVGIFPFAPAQITQHEWDEVLSFVRELRPMLQQFGDLGEKLKAGGLAGIAAAMMARRS